MWYLHTTGNNLEVHWAGNDDPGTPPAGQTKVNSAVPAGWYPYSPKTLLEKFDDEMSAWTDAEKEEAFKLYPPVSTACICHQSARADALIDASTVLSAQQKTDLKATYA